MLYKRSNDRLVVRLEPGDEVHASLLSAAQASGIKQAVVISGIGQLSRTKLGFFTGAEGKYAHQEFMGAAEVLTLAGNICERDGGIVAHLHAVLGRDDYSVFGGHLVEGYVSATLEVLLLVVEGIRMYRKIEQPSGLPGLYIE
jgi:predicted DNA-binding protein with PD1-like motif